MKRSFFLIRQTQVVSLVSLLYFLGHDVTFVSANPPAPAQCTSDSQCYNKMRSQIPRSSSVGVGLCDCYAASTTDRFDECEGQGNNCRIARCRYKECVEYDAICLFEENESVGSCVLDDGSDEEVELDTLGDFEADVLDESSGATEVTVANEVGNEWEEGDFDEDTVEDETSSQEISQHVSEESVASVVKPPAPTSCISDDECYNTIRTQVPNQSNVGVGLCDCYAASTVDPFDECEGRRSGCRVARCMYTECVEFGAFCSFEGNESVGMCVLDDGKREEVDLESLEGLDAEVFDDAGDNIDSSGANEVQDVDSDAELEESTDGDEAPSSENLSQSSGNSNAKGNPPAPASCTSDGECYNTIRSQLPSVSTVGVGLCNCYAASTVDPFDECEGQKSGCRVSRCVYNDCVELDSFCSIIENEAVGECVLDDSKGSGPQVEPFGGVDEDIGNDRSDDTNSTDASEIDTAQSQDEPQTENILQSSNSVSTFSAACNSDEECFPKVRGRAPENIKAGVKLCACYAASSIDPFDECEGKDTHCRMAKCGDSCDESEAYCSISSADEIREGFRGACSLKHMHSDEKDIDLQETQTGASGLSTDEQFLSSSVAATADSSGHLLKVTVFGITSLFLGLGTQMRFMFF